MRKTAVPSPRSAGPELGRPPTGAEGSTKPRRRAGWLALGLGLSLGAGCGEGDGARLGMSLRLGADWNGWATSASAPELTWDGERYHAVVTLPGDDLELRLYSPETGLLVGHPRGTPAQPVASTAQTLAAVSDVPPLRLALPLLARYELSFDPRRGELHVDLAEDADAGLEPAGAALVRALRGADRLSPDERKQRAATLRTTLAELAVETPLAWSSPEHQGLTFLHLDSVDHAELSVIGDFNAWTPGRDPMSFVLDGTVAYHARRGAGARLEYRFDLHGRRYVDPRNPEVAWDGVVLPPSPGNLLGGNVGELNSVAYAPGYVPASSRLRRLPLPEGGPSSEVLVYLPAGYGKSGRRYPSLYLHDGKDALVRGGYDRTLDRLAQSRQIPEVVAILIAPPADPVERLATFATNTDPTFPQVTPRGVAYERFLTDVVVPLVEKTYRTGEPRALLGIDLAGPLSFHLVWSDPQARFTRAASQSGRFGWGADGTQPSPYLEMMKSDQSSRISRLAFDFSDTDQAQASAAVHDSVQKLLNLPSYSGKVQFRRKSVASATAWECLRTRLEGTLPFLLGDLTQGP